MTSEIAIVLTILVAAILLFITEWVRLDVVAILVLVSLALSGLVSPGEALSGFMNDIGVASLFLPVVIDIARRTKRPPS